MCAGDQECFLGSDGRKGTLLGKEHVGGKRKGVREDESWCRLDPMLSLDLRLHHSGRRAPMVWSLPLASLQTAGRPPLPLPQQKFQTFSPAGRGRVLLSLKGKSLPLPGFLLVGAGPIPARIAGGLAVVGEPRRRPWADRRGPPGGRQVGPGPPALPPPLRACSPQTLRFARGSDAPRSAGAGLPGLGHEEPQVPPEEAGRVRPRAVRRHRPRQRGESRGPWAPRTPGAALPRAAESFSVRLCLTASLWVGPGDSSSLLWPGLRVGPETVGTLPTAAPGPRRIPFPPLIPGSPSSWPSGLDRTLLLNSVFGVVPHPGPSPATPAPPRSRAGPRIPRAL